MPRRRDPHPTIATPRLTLRQFRETDADAMHACLSDPVATRFWNMPIHGKRIETERAVRRFIDCTPSYYRYWAVCDPATDRCFGMVNYHDGHIRNRRASIGYIIDPVRQRRGMGAEAVTALLEHCFGALELHRLEAFIHPDNAASRALVERQGFRCEGRLQEHLRVGDEWRDELIYALLAPEWRKPRKNAVETGPS